MFGSSNCLKLAPMRLRLSGGMIRLGKLRQAKGSPLVGRHSRKPDAPAKIRPPFGAAASPATSALFECVDAHDLVLKQDLVKLFRKFRVFSFQNPVLAQAGFFIPVGRLRDGEIEA